MIALCAVLSGGQGAVDMALFARAKEPFLRGFLKRANGPPSHDTFSRLFRQLDPVRFGAALQRFMAGFCQQIEGVVAIDGKVLRRSFDRAQGAGPAIRQQSAELGQRALILRRASVGHDLGDRREGRTQGHAALAGLKARGSDLHRAEQRPQPPRPSILQRSLRPASRAAPPGLAMLLGLSLDMTALHAGQDQLGVGQRQPQGGGRAAGVGSAAAGMHLERLNRIGHPGQFDNHPPMHPALQSP